MPTIRRDMRDGYAAANGHSGKTETNGDSMMETLDAVVVGAGFAGVYIHYKLRQAGFETKIIEAGTGLGGIWEWNRYPDARVDSQYPIYAYSLPEVYEDWYWKSDYPDHTELREYFEHVDKKLGIKKDTYFETAVETAHWDDDESMWTLQCNTGLKVKARHFVACIGFAAKRYFPDWEGYEDFEGFICHSSFWPHEGIDVRGKKCAVIGTGATGVQISQAWGRNVGEEGSMKVFQRTPNLACPMNQKYLTKEQQDKDKERYPELFEQRWQNYNGFLYQYRPELMMDHTPEERKELFDMLWDWGGFRFLMNNYFDMTRELKANRIAYDYWRAKIHEKVKDPKKAEVLAPKEPPHPFGGKRLSLEQDYYDNFNKPNVDVVDTKNNPIVKFEKNGLRQEDGTFHELDLIALATGFDSITGGIKNIEIKGRNGELLTDKWKLGTYTYLGMTTTGFPNFYFTYGPQGPTAFSNGPSCNELQGDWIVGVVEHMKKTGLKSFDPKLKEEQRWKAAVNELSTKGVRGHTNSWYNGSNIPGKPIEPLNYAGGLPLYIKEIGNERENGYPGFDLQ